MIGDGNTSDTDQTGGSSPTGSGSETNGQDGTGSGNQTSPAVTLPVDTSDNQFTVIGDGNTNTGSDEGDSTGPGTTPEQAGTETGQPEEGGTQGETQGGSGLTAGPTGSDGSRDSTSPGGRSALTGMLVAGAAVTQAGPAAVAGVLPATGSSAALLLWALLALALLVLGMFLVGGQFAWTEAAPSSTQGGDDDLSHRSRQLRCPPATHAADGSGRAGAHHGRPLGRTSDPSVSGWSGVRFPLP